MTLPPARGQNSEVDWVVCRFVGGLSIESKLTGTAVPSVRRHECQKGARKLNQRLVRVAGFASAVLVGQWMSSADDLLDQPPADKYFVLILAANLSCDSG